jgi:hypothetical protein
MWIKECRTNCSWTEDVDKITSKQENYRILHSGQYTYAYSLKYLQVINAMNSSQVVSHVKIKLVFNVF